jgi:hypothetical protein
MLSLYQNGSVADLAILFEGIIVEGNHEKLWR